MSKNYGYVGFGPIFDVHLAQNEDEVRDMLVELLKHRRGEGAIKIEPWNPRYWEKAGAGEVLDFLQTHIPTDDEQVLEVLQRAREKLQKLRLKEETR